MARCPSCGERLTEIEPLDENLDAGGQPIREFECSLCESVFTEDELTERDDV